jgi:hypothetical protein
MRTNWWRHLLVSIPLGWCGLWAWWLWSLILVPLFGWACVRAAQQARPLLLLHAVPAVVMLGLHAAVANPYTRYNLILIGPFSVGAAWIISALLPNRCSRLRVLGTGPRRTRSIAAGRTPHRKEAGQRASGLRMASFSHFNAKATISSSPACGDCDGLRTWSNEPAAK